MSFTLLGILNAQAAGAGGAGAYDLLETTVLTTSASSVSFTGLDAYTDYKHLQLRATDRASGALVSRNIALTFNSDSTASYADHELFGDGSTVSSTASTSQSRIIFGTLAASNSSNVFSSMVMDLLDFSSSNKNTTVRALRATTFTAASPRITLLSGLFFKPAALTSVNFEVLGDDFVTGSRFSLYGLKG